MDSQKQQVVERLKQANNILVTVRSNPSVDQLAACIGVTLALNKMGKHATAVFSGAVPSTIEFLQPEKTLEKNTDSLQDFIIALDKSKADKLRYKVEDTMVKIFITPYRTSINQNDLQFSQGDFNVDVVLTLGVHAQSDLDQAITSHGRILHDATVMSINTNAGGELGSINWLDAGVSSLSELGVQLIDALGQQLMDGQIATAFLTGIVAETDRFSNEKTSPQTMSISAELMSAGANQQLVATKLEEPAPTPQPVKPIAESMPEQQPVSPETSQPELTEEPAKPKDDGTIEISHNEQPAPTPQEEKPQSLNLPPVLPVEPTQETIDESQAPQIHIDEHGMLRPLEKQSEQPSIKPAADYLPPEQPLPPIVKEEGPRLMTEPPTFETPALTANAQPEKEDMAADPLSLPDVGLLNREPLPSQQTAANSAPSAFSPQPSALPTTPPSQPSIVPSAAPDMPTQGTFSTPPAPSAAPWTPPADTGLEGTKTLSQIEQDVHSPHADAHDSILPPNPAQPNVVSPSTGSNVSEAQGTAPTNVNDARDAVAQAISANPDTQRIQPSVELNALPLGDQLHGPDAQNQQPDQITMQPPVTFQPNSGQAPPQSPPPIVPPAYPQQ